MQQIGNDEFEAWVEDIESKHGVECANSRPARDDFIGALEDREHLSQRCRDVGSKLPMKQKQFERRDDRVKHFESHSEVGQTPQTP